jgi:hypothetical protein
MVVASVESIGYRVGFSLAHLMRHWRNRKRWEEDDNQQGSFLSAEVGFTKSALRRPPTNQDPNRAVRNFRIEVGF